MTPEALADLHARAMTVPAPFTADEFTTWLDAPGVFLGALDGGFALGRAVAGEAELLTIAVLPEARRAGLGRRLLADFEAGAQDRRARAGFLEVAADNAAARSLYEAAKWHEVGRRKAYYRLPDGTYRDALVMTKAFAL